MKAAAGLRSTATSGLKRFSRKIVEFLRFEAPSAVCATITDHWPGKFDIKRQQKRFLAAEDDFHLFETFSLINFKGVAKFFYKLLTAGPFWWFTKAWRMREHRRIFFVLTFLQRMEES